VAADEEVVQREREVGASRPEVDDAQAPLRESWNDVVDELHEAVDLAELPAALRAHAAVRGLDAELHEERDGLPFGQEVALLSVVDALRLRPRRWPLQDARRIAAGEDLPVGIGLLQERLPVACADCIAKEGDEPRAVEVLVHGSALVVATHAPAVPLAEGHPLDGDPPRLVRVRLPWPAERRPRQRRFADEPLDEIVDVPHSAGATTQTSCPLATATPALTARPRTTPTRGATISFSIFIASTTHSS